MSAFPDELISALVAAGFYVLRTDHRDSGQSDYEAQHSGLVPSVADTIPNQGSAQLAA